MVAAAIADTAAIRADVVLRLISRVVGITDLASPSAAVDGTENAAVCLNFVRCARPGRSETGLGWTGPGMLPLYSASVELSIHEPHPISRGCPAMADREIFECARRVHGHCVHDSRRRSAVCYRAFGGRTPSAETT